VTIKEYYTSTYATDELGLDIDSSATFEGLFETLDSYKDVYEYIGVDDSVIRERVFEKLAEIMQCDYEYIYNQWLLGN
jgi:hypothetical protein